MATFSVNQTRQLYVANAYKTPSIVATDELGSIAVKADNAKTHLYFEYKGAGGLTRSDLITIDNIISAKATDADSLAHQLAKYKVVLDPTINTGLPVAGQDYLLRIAFRNYFGLSDEHMYHKYGAVHVYAGMTASDFYKTLVISLVKNFSRELTQPLKFYLETGGTDPATVNGTPTEVTQDTKEDTLTDTYTGIVIEEAPQDWVLGTYEQAPANFTLQPDQITVQGDERLWGKVAKVESTSVIPNGHKTADMEYFYMGERGDTYRMLGFPNVIRTKYLVDPDKKYNVIDIHYSYIGHNESVQKSEKTITIVVPKIGETNSVSNVLTNNIINAINTATGLNIATLGVES